MVEIIPAVIPKNYEDLKNNIALVRGVASVVQIDLCDGIFVKNTTWPFHGDDFDLHFKAILNEQEGMPFWEDVDFELDMMVENAVDNFDLYTKLGPKRIIFHVEAVGDLDTFKDFLEGIDMYIRDSIQIGVAINPSTSLEKLYPLTNHIDFVQCMGSDQLGFHGVELDERVYENIKVLRDKYSDLPIAVDIGVNESTAPRLVEAGATKLVAGSAIFNTDDIISKIEWFKNL
jgi:ribulose-phosphate 3-epimerase